MDHEEAIAAHAAERYALRQMEPPEAEAYERHYFGCEECARELENAAMFADNARAVLNESPALVSAPAAGSPGFASRLRVLFAQPGFVAAAACAAVLAAIVAYQSLVLVPTLRQELAATSQPRAFLAFAVKASTRGDENAIQIGTQAEYFAIHLDLPEYAYPEYVCEIESTPAGWRRQVRSVAPPAGSPLAILLSARQMPPGVYNIRVLGANGSAAGPPVAGFSFVLSKGAGP